MAGENGKSSKGGRGRGRSGGGGGSGGGGRKGGRGRGGQGRSGGQGGQGGQGQGRRKPSAATLSPRKGKAFSSPYEMTASGAIAPFDLFCCYLLGIMPDGSYRQSNNPNVGEVAKRCGRHPADMKALLKEYGMTQESLAGVDFDISLARLDMQVAPEGMDRRELARGLYDEFMELHEELARAEQRFNAGEITLPERSDEGRQARQPEADSKEDDAGGRRRGRNRNRNRRDGQDRADRPDRLDRPDRADRDGGERATTEPQDSAPRSDQDTPAGATPAESGAPAGHAAPAGHSAPEGHSAPAEPGAPAERGAPEGNGVSPTNDVLEPLAADSPSADDDPVERPVRRIRRTPVRRGG